MTEEEIIKMARQIFDIDVDRRGRETYVCDEYGLATFAKLVEEKEREECAKIADAEVDELNEGEWTGCAQYLANNIRARGQK